MCLLTRFPRIKTKKDIEVYKVLRHDLTSPYQGYQYSLTSLAVSNLKAYSAHLIPSEYAEDVLPNKIVRTLNKSKIDIQNINLHIQFINEGLHSYRDVHDAILAKTPERIICKAIIPAGSYIYINYNEIVSDKLIIKRRVL